MILKGSNFLIAPGATRGFENLGIQSFPTLKGLPDGKGRVELMIKELEAFK